MRFSIQDDFHFLVFNFNPSVKCILSDTGKYLPVPNFERLLLTCPARIQDVQSITLSWIENFVRTCSSFFGIDVLYDFIFWDRCSLWFFEKSVKNSLSRVRGVDHRKLSRFFSKFFRTGRWPFLKISLRISKIFYDDPSNP